MEAKKGVERLELKRTEKAGGAVESDVTNAEKVTEMLISEIQKKCCWSEKMADMKQSRDSQLRKFI